MSTIAKPPTSALIVLAVAAFWYLSQRKAAAGTPIYGTQGALKNRAVQGYAVTPSRTVPVTGASGVAASLLQGVAGLFSGVRLGGAAGLPAVESAANAYGFDAVQPGTELENAYQFGGPSMGVYGSTAADIANGFKLGNDADYYGVVTNPATFTGDPYNDGGGNYDVIIAQPAPNIDWPLGEDLNYGW